MLEMKSAHVGAMSFFVSSPSTMQHLGEIRLLLRRNASAYLPYYFPSACSH